MKLSECRFSLFQESLEVTCRWEGIVVVALLDDGLRAKHTDDANAD